MDEHPTTQLARELVARDKDKEMVHTESLLLARRLLALEAVVDAARFEPFGRQDDD